MCVLSSYLTLFLFAYSVSFIYGSRLVYHNEASLPDELDLLELFIADPVHRASVIKRDGQNPKGTTGLWFGPRLGRRKRDTGADDERRKREIGDSTLLTKEEALRLFTQDMPWALLSLKGGKRRNVNFTPRLGRDSEEDMVEDNVGPSYGSYMRTPARSGMQTQGSVGSNFTPRLGRLAPIEPH